MSSHSVTENLDKTFQRIKYPNDFISITVDCKPDALEIQVWLKFTDKYWNYNSEVLNDLVSEHDEILSMLVKMRNQPDKWSI